MMPSAHYPKSYRLANTWKPFFGFMATCTCTMCASQTKFGTNRFVFSKVLGHYISNCINKQKMIVGCSGSKNIFDAQLKKVSKALDIENLITFFNCIIPLMVLGLKLFLLLHQVLCSILCQVHVMSQYVR